MTLKHTSLQTLPVTCMHGTPMNHRSRFCACWHALHILLLKCRNGLHDIHSIRTIACVHCSHMCAYILARQWLRRMSSRPSNLGMPGSRINERPMVRP